MSDACLGSMATNGVFTMQNMYEDDEKDTVLVGTVDSGVLRVGMYGRVCGLYTKILQVLKDGHPANEGRPGELVELKLTNISEETVRDAAGSTVIFLTETMDEDMP